MAPEERISELHQRLERLESELAEKRQKHSAAGTLAPHHHREAEEIRSRSEAMRERLSNVDAAGWNAMKHEIEADWDSLMGSFERWVRHVDRDYPQGN